MYLRCNPDVHFVFPDFPFIVHLSTSGFSNVRECNLHIFAQMYGDVFNRQMYKNVLQMYSKCTSDVHLDFPEWKGFLSDEDVLKCTQMYPNLHLRCTFSKCTPNVCQMYPRCTPHIHSFHSRPITQWSVLNSCCECSLRFGVIFSLVLLLIFDG